MNLGIFLSPGESISSMKKTGQDVRFIELYLKIYAKKFEKVYLFSYVAEKPKLPKNIILVSNKTRLPRLVYALLLPFVNKQALQKCDVIRGFGLASSLSTILTNRPFVFNWAYDYIHSVKIEKKFWYIPLYYLLEKIAFLKAKRVLIATVEKFKKCKGGKFIYLPNGVDVSLFKGSEITGSGAVFVGRLEKQKNLFFLIDAISKLKKPEIDFIGGGSHKFELEKYAIGKKVVLRIIPSVPNSKLPNLLKKYSIFTLPSFSEGSPKALLEAMSLGLIPVVTNFRTAKEVVKDDENGLIVNYNAQEFADKIKFLMKNKNARARFSQAAVRTIKRDFDQRKLISKEVSILKNA